MNYTMEVFTTSYMTYLCFAPYLIVLFLLVCKFANSVLIGNGADAMVFLTLGIFLMLTYSPIDDIRKDSFLETRMEQLDGVETYSERLTRTGENW